MAGHIELNFGATTKRNKSDSSLEGTMRGNGCQRMLPTICVAVGALFLCSVVAHGQDGRGESASSAPSSEATPEIRVLADLIRDLQAQVQTLN
jgi:hypothetical protein